MPTANFTYVYILQSIPHPAHHYVGLTTDLQSRLAKHNEGGTPHTAPFRPWSIKTATAFSDPSRAATFEHYLKSASGRAFTTRHF